MHDRRAVGIGDGGELILANGTYTGSGSTNLLSVSKSVVIRAAAPGGAARVRIGTGAARAQRKPCALLHGWLVLSRGHIGSIFYRYYCS